MAVRLIRSTNIDSLVPIKSKPRKGFDDLLVRLFAVALLVGVFNAEDKGSTGVTSVGPVEQSGADQANVRSTGRARAKANPDIFSGGS